MSTLEVAVSSPVGAPAQDVYDILADYEQHHPQILPERYFKELVIEEGGRGEGTVFRLTMQAFGGTRKYHMRVTEPEPGRVLAETDMDSGLLTTFTVEPAGEQQCTVTIKTVWRIESGIRGLLERSVTPLMRHIYREELQNLDAYARGLQPSADA